MLEYEKLSYAVSCHICQIILDNNIDDNSKHIINYTLLTNLGYGLVHMHY